MIKKKDWEKRSSLVKVKVKVPYDAAGTRLERAVEVIVFPNFF
jgi:hypothetical protein